MNKNLLFRMPRILINKKYLLSSSPFFNPSKKLFSSQKYQQDINHRFTYGQGGQFAFDLKNRTYSLSFETIWEDYAQLTYSGLTGQKSFFITQKGKYVNMDDQDLQSNEKEFIKIHSKIPEDYTIKGKINGSIHHLKNSVSSKTRCNPFEIQILGYKNTYQWLNLECQDVKITNIHGEVNIGSLTAKNALIDCQTFKSKKVLFSGQVTFKVSSKAEIRSVVSYQDSLTKIQNSGDIYLESLSGRFSVKNCKVLKIDRLLSCKDGIQIQCDKINDHIIIESGTGTIKCLKQSKQVLKQKIKLGKMHKGKLDFEIYENLNSPFSKILIDL